MIPDYYYRVADFLADVFGFPPGASFPPDPVVIKTMIAILINCGFATHEQLSQTAIAEHNLIIREDLFPQEDER